MMRFLIPALFLLAACNLEDKPATPRMLQKRGYEAQYSSNWSVDSSSDDFDPDHYLMLQAPRDKGMILLIRQDVPMDEREQLQNHIAAQTKSTIRDGKVTYFKRWGAFRGHGAVIRGKFMGLLNGSMRIFCHATDASSFVVIEQHMEEGKALEKGFTLFEQSFRLHADSSAVPEAATDSL